MTKPLAANKIVDIEVVLPEDVLDGVKTMAKKKKVAYKKLIARILHNFAKGRLVDLDKKGTRHGCQKRSCSQAISRRA